MSLRLTSIDAKARTSLVADQVETRAAAPHFPRVTEEANITEPHM
jgi:hypothetical protein